MRPLVSIIVPIYNGASFIKETVQSCLDQTYENWELIIIDDGSTDNSAEIIKGFLSDKVRYFRKENGGQASARNLGIEKSKGDWIAFLDADDIWVAEKLQKQIFVIENDSELDLIFCHAYVFQEKKNQKQEYPSWKTDKLKGPNFVKELFCRSGIINSSVLLKKESLSDLQFDEGTDIIGTEDWDLWLRLALANKTFYGLEDKLVYYREHEGGIHMNLVKMFFGKEQLYLKHQNQIQVPRLLAKKQFRYVYRELMNHLYEQGKTNDIKIVFERFKKQDRWGWGTLKQRLLIKVFPIKSFMWLSNKIIYRIAYRLEKLRYYFFLNE
ncbi:MAG: teichuronic acid biosynthesis glycosyltransferase TuaG [Arenicella sp.]|jgi:teichuronic acid biosynthesis glycosyltransferase TuaG